MDESLSNLAPMTSVIALALAAAASAVFLLLTPRKQNDRLPQQTTMSLSDFVTAMGSPDAPFRLLSHVRSLPTNRSIFRVPLWIPGYPAVVMVGDAQVARQIWKDSNSLRATLILKPLEASMGGPNMLTTNGPFWKKRRKGIHAAFASKHIKRMEKVASEKVQQWITSKLHASADTLEMDIAQAMLHLGLDIMSETAFEYTMTENQRNSFLKNNYLQLEEFFTKSFTNPLRMGMMWCLPDRKKAWEASMANLEFCRAVLRSYESKPVQERTPGTIIDSLVSNPCYSNETELLADMLLMLAASHDSTGFSVSFILIELAKDIEYQSRLRNELRVIRGNRQMEHGSTIPWNDSILLQYAIKEGMRMYPVFGLGPGSRIVGSDVVYEELISSDNNSEIQSQTRIIPKGSLALTSILMMQRDARLFDSPDQFRPLRWEQATEDQRLAMSTFAHGAQNCVGQGLANMIIPLVVGTLLCDHELTLAQEGNTVFAGSLKPVATKLCIQRCSS